MAPKDPETPIPPSPAPRHQMDKPSSRVIKTNSKTYAAKWNAKVLYDLTAALRKDPEVDLTTVLSPGYSKRLQSIKSGPRPSSLLGAQKPKPLVPPQNKAHLGLNPTDVSTVIFGLSAELQTFLPNPSSDSLSGAILHLVEQGEVLYTWASCIQVVRISENLVVKLGNEEDAIMIECHSLVFLQEHLPSFPAPRPHGVVRFGQLFLLFTTFIPGTSLEKVWPELNDIEKRSISAQLNILFSSLRSLPPPDNTPFGSVNDGCCKDIRRWPRASSKPITTIGQFEDFIFSASRVASPVYIQLLRDLKSMSPSECVFTHSDLRPANIMVVKDECSWKVAGVIDWEASGFYPDYWESVKMTNNLAPRDTFDWYLYLPESISLKRYPIQWLVDRLWDFSMENSS